MFVEKQIVDNVNTVRITEFLKKKDIKREDADRGMEYHLWLGKIIGEGKVSSKEINECLYRELMFGSRRLIRLYELNNIRKIKHTFNWNDFLKQFNCQSMNFNKILETNFNQGEDFKIAAIKSISDDKNVLEFIEILFVFKMKVRFKINGSEYVYSYIPVNLNFQTKTMTLKIWNREGADENYTPADQLEKIYSLLTSMMKFETKSITINPQKVLYRMSKGLFNEFFKSLPNTLEIERKKESLDKIVSGLLEGITLENSVVENGYISMNSEVINVKEEMYKLLQQVALYDYLKDNKLEKLLQDTDKVIARIRFSDRDNLSASLIGEKGVKCIFDTKTFMCIRNSLDLVEKLVTITITFNQSKGKMTAKYDASDSRYLVIHILKDKYYSEEDYKKIWELYKKYEVNDVTTISDVCAKDNTQAM